MKHTQTAPYPCHFHFQSSARGRVEASRYKDGQICAINVCLWGQREDIVKRHHVLVHKDHI
jgi:hypothetical protein